MNSLGQTRTLPGRVPAPRPPAAAMLPMWGGLSALGTVFVVLVFSDVVFGASMKLGRPAVATLAFVACYGIALLALVVEWPRVVRGLVQHWYLLLIPAVAIGSMMWSGAPDYTLRMSIQLGMTVLIGVVLGAANTPLRLMRLVRTTLAFGVFLSVVVVLVEHPMAFDETGIPSGMFSHKNLFGQASALLAVISLQLLMVDRRPWRNLAFLALGLLAVVVSESALSLVLVTVSGALLVVLQAGRGNLPGRVLVVAVLLMAAAAGLGTLAMLNAGMMEAVLDLLGRNATLTGRTILWENAWQQIMARPLLGFGYGAFWHPGVNPDAVYVSSLIIWWDPGALLPHFHNGFLQILVDLGAVGFGLVVLTFLGFLLRGLAEYGTGASRMSAWPLVLIVFVLIANLAEHALFRNHELLTLYLIATMVSHGLARQRGGRP